MTLPEHYRGKRTLVTGGLGFIGSTLATELVRLGAEVTVLDSLIPEHGGNLFNLRSVKNNLRINISDMREQASLNILVQDQDYIFHLAGQVSHGDSMRDPQLDLAVNCISTMNLVEACRRFNPTVRLLYTSTRQVYGKPLRLPVGEDHPTIPIDVNGINKLAAEYYHLLYDRTYGVRSVVLRLTNTYGPRQQVRSNRQGFIGIMIRQALLGETIKVFGSGEQLRDFNYVDDVVQAILLAACSESCFGRVFNLGADERYSLLEFLNVLNELCPLRYEFVPFPEDKGIIDIGDYYGDYTALRMATGWKPEVSLPEGLERTIKGYNAHREVYL
jgi:UDP-glucose 4-epimerase